MAIRLGTNFLMSACGYVYNFFEYQILKQIHMTIEIALLLWTGLLPFRIWNLYIITSP